MLEFKGAPTCITMAFAPGSESSVAKGLNDGLVELNKAWAPNASFTYKISYSEDLKNGIVVQKVEIQRK